MHCDLLRSIVLPVYYFPASPISVQTFKIYPLGHVWVVEALQTFVQKWTCDIVIDSHSHSRCSTVSLPLKLLLHKRFISFKIICRWPFRPRCPVSRPTTMDSCCLLMLSSLVTLLCWDPSMRAMECLQSLLDFQHSVCFLSIQFPIAHLTTLYGRPSAGSSKWSVCTLLSQFISPLIAQNALMPQHPHQLNWMCFASSSRNPRQSRTNLDLTVTDSRAFKTA